MPRDQLDKQIISEGMIVVVKLKEGNRVGNYHAVCALELAFACTSVVGQEKQANQLHPSTASSHEALITARDWPVCVQGCLQV